MRFLVDRCVGRRLAVWLRGEGHDVIEARELGADPGDLALLNHAAAQGRILVTMDTDFGQLVYPGGAPHKGLLRLPDVPPDQCIALISEVLEQHWRDLEDQAIVTVRGDRIRVSRSPNLL